MPTPTTTPEAGGTRRFRPALALILALAAGCALYVPNLRLQLLADDFAFLSGAQSTPLLRWLGTTAGVSYYRPFSRQLYVAAMTHLFGPRALPFHVVNLALLLLTAWLLARLAGRLASPAAGVVAATVLLAQHGASVLTAWGACAQDLFAVSLTAATLVLHLSGRTWLGVLACAAALLSKETAAAAPLLVLLVEWYTPGRTPGVALRRSVPYLAILAAWALAYGLWFRHFPGAPPVGVLDVQADPAAWPRVLARSLLALINLDAGLAMPGRAVDLVRAVAAGVLGLAAILVVPWSTRRAPGARRMVAPPGGKRREPSGRGGRKGPGAPAARRGWRPSPLLVLGAGWLLLGVLPVLLVGHRWSTYLTVMMGAGSALLAASVLHRHAWAAALASGYLLLSGPAADAVTGGPFEAGSNSVWSLPRVRRLSEFVGGLRGVLRDHRPRLPRGTAVLLSRMPNMSLVAVHGADAVRAWYADPTLTFAPIESLLTVASHRQVVVLDCDPSVEPNRWSVERPEFVTLRLRAQRALDTEQWLEAARLIEQTRAAPEWRVLSEAWRAGALLTLGQIYQRHNRPTDAEPVYREAVKLDPELTDAWYGLGAVLALRGAYGKSEQALAIAAGRAPDHPLFQFSYGALMLENGRDPALAASHLRRSLELGLEEPSRSVALSLLRQAEAKQAGSAR